MEDFNTLASSLAAGLGDVRGCLILSRDGLVLGASPAEAEATATPAWVRFAALGDTERGFVQFGAESWCYVRRGPYAAFAIAGPGARPGLVLDQMDQALLAAEQGRHEGFPTRSGEASPPPTSRPRTLLHPEPTHGKEPVVIDVPRTPAGLEASADRSVEDRDLGFGPLPRMFDPRPADEPSAATAPVHPAGGPEPTADPVEPAFPTPSLDEPAVPAGPHEPTVPAGPHEPAAHAEPGPAPFSPGPAPTEPDLDLAEPVSSDEPGAPGPSAREAPPRDWEPEDDEHDDVDRFSLAQEFGQLLQQGEDPADG